MIRHFAYLPLVAMLVLTFPVSAGEDKPAAPEEAAPKDNEKTDTETESPIKAVMPIKLSEHEAKLHAMIANALPGEDGKGGRAYMKARQMKTVTLRETILRALEKNLTIVQQGKNEQISKEALEEAKAVFDPTFSVSAAFDKSEKFDRKQKARRYHTATEAFDLNGNGVIDSGEENVLILDKEVQAEVGIFALVYRDPRPAGLVKDYQTASREGAEGPIESLTYKFNVSQQLPWGNSVQIGYSLKRRETYYLQGFRTISTQTREYNRPFGSTIDVNLVIPAPFLKDFGRHSGAETSIEVARVAQERAFWDTKTVINSTLLIVDIAYWNVVGTLEALRAAGENRMLLEAQLKAVEERLKAGRTTDYGRQQTISQLASVKSFEAAAWNAYERASNALVNVLDLDEKTVVFPAGYSQYDEMKLDAAEDKVVSTGLESRPELKAEKSNEESSDILLLFAENQQRPDLKLGIGLTFAQQLDQLFGFRTAAISMGNLTRPDTITQKYSATYTRPWDNRALKAAHRQALIAVSQQGLSSRDVKNLIEQQISDALIGFLSSKKQLEIAKSSLEKARIAYDQSQELYKVNRLTEFEQIAKTSDLLSADLAFITAAINFKKAEAQLLQAQGILASNYAERTSAGAPLEKHRLQAVAASKDMKFFPSAEAVAIEAPKADALPVDPAETAQNTDL